MNHGAAILANLIWGMVPAYYYLVRFVDPLQMTAYRFIFTFLLLFLASVALRRSYSIRLLRSSIFPAILLTANAYIYLVAVLQGHVLEAVYGYLMAPILTIILGRIILQERLSFEQWAGAGVCLAAITVYAGMTDILPWFGFGIAAPFAFYLIWHRRQDTPSSVEALKHESVVMLILPFLLLANIGREYEMLELFNSNIGLGFIIAASGLITVVPLVLYVNSCPKLSISYLGAYQFVAPIVSALLAIILFDETVTAAKAITGTGLFIGLVLVTFPIGKLFKRTVRM